MKIILKHILRNIKEKKGRSILIILSLMIASTVLILNLTIPNQIVETKSQQARDAIGKSDILVASFDPFNIKDVNMGSEKINYVGVNDLYIIHKDKTLVIYGTDNNQAASLKLIDNVDLLDDEIIISKTTADKYNYKVNDIISINVDEVYFNLKVKSIVDNKGLMYFKTLSGLVNNNTYNKITGNTTNTFRTYYIDVLDEEKINDYNESLKKNNKNYMFEKLVDEDKIREDNQYTIVILIIIFVMATIMIFFVVSTLNKMIVLERMPVIGTFRSVGASKKKMNMLLILENSIYGLIGGIIGGIVSLIGYKFAIQLLLGGEAINASMPAGNIIIGIIFTILLEIVMSLGAIIKSNKYSIKEIMFDNKNSKSTISIVSTVISIILIVGSILLYLFTPDTNALLDLLGLVGFWIGVAYFIPALMAILSKLICGIAKSFNLGSLFMAGKNLGNNKLLISSTRLVVVSLSIMLVILNVSASFNKMIDSARVQFDDHDILVRFVEKKYTEYERLYELDNVLKVDNLFMYSEEGAITYNGGKKLDAGPMMLGMKDVRGEIIELNYKIKDLKYNECLFDEVLLKNNHLKIGDTIKLYFEKTGKYLDVKIVGTVNSFYMSTQREIIVIQEETYKDYITEVPFEVSVKVKNIDNVRDTIDEIERVLKDPDITVMTVDDFCDMQKDNINTIMSLFYIVISLVLGLSFVGIVNNQLISFMERTKELAVLNSVCMSKKQIRKMLITENITSNVVACAFGFIVSIISVYLMDRLLCGIKMYSYLKFEYGIGFLIIGSVLVLLLVTVIVPIKKLKKINVVEAIKYE